MNPQRSWTPLLHCSIRLESEPASTPPLSHLLAVGERPATSFPTRHPTPKTGYPEPVLEPEGRQAAYLGQEKRAGGDHIDGEGAHWQPFHRLQPLVCLWKEKEGATLSYTGGPSP